jgi:acetolactate synthase-1/3 small subunit
MMQTDEASADRLVQQLRKSFGVRAAVMFPAGDAVTREITLIKVRAAADRADLLAVVAQCQAAVVDEGAGTCIVEVAGAPARTEACLQALDRFGILEIARSAAAMRSAASSSPSPAPNNPSEAVL